MGSAPPDVSRQHILNRSGKVLDCTLATYRELVPVLIIVNHYKYLSVGETRILKALPILHVEIKYI